LNFIDGPPTGQQAATRQNAIGSPTATVITPSPRRGRRL
jgi:hypothetical protein